MKRVSVGRVVSTETDRVYGPQLGVEAAGGRTLHIPFREADRRLLRVGNEVLFRGKGEEAEIIFPTPRIGCERER